MSEPIRLSPEEVREKIKSGQALLVCAYDSPNKFRVNHLEGAMSLDEFKSKLSSIFYDQEIIFYCGWTKEASAAGRAEEFMNKGYTNVKVLGGGVGGWRNAGYEVIP